MSSKLFTEKIGRAIDLHKDRDGWAATDNELFVQEIFSGNYNEKNLEGFKDLIVKHSQIFIYKKEGNRMLVKRRHPEPLKTASSRFIAFWGRLWKIISSFFKRLFAPQKGKESQKPQQHESEKRAERPRNREEKSRSSETRGPKRDESLRPATRARFEDEKGRRASSSNGRSTRYSSVSEDKVLRGEQRRERQDRPVRSNRDGGRSLSPSAVRNDAPLATKQSDTDYRSAKSRADNRREERGMRLVDFAYLGDYNQYLDACKALLARIPEKIFTTDLDGEYDKVLINFPVYINNVFLDRYRRGEVLQKGSYAAFHTGIFDNDGQGIYAIFSSNEEPPKDERKSPAYRFLAFTSSDASPSGRILKEHFPTLPTYAFPLSGERILPEQLFFDPFKPINKGDGRNILANCLFHLPREVVEQIPSLKGYAEKLAPLKGPKKVALMKSLARKAAEDKEAYASVSQLVDDAVEKAFRGLRSNPLLARPALDSFRNTLFLLIPLEVFQTGSPDMMLELYSTPKGYEYGMLCSISKGTLAMRTLSSLPSDWLTSAVREQFPNA